MKRQIMLVCVLLGALVGAAGVGAATRLEPPVLTSCVVPDWLGENAMNCSDSNWVGTGSQIAQLTADYPDISEDWEVRAAWAVDAGTWADENGVDAPAGEWRVLDLEAGRFARVGVEQTEPGGDGSAYLVYEQSLDGGENWSSPNTGVAGGGDGPGAEWTYAAWSGGSSGEIGEIDLSPLFGTVESAIEIGVVDGLLVIAALIMIYLTVKVIRRTVRA